MRLAGAVALGVQLLTGCPGTAFSQPAAQDTVRVEHIQSFPNHFFLGPVVKHKEHLFRLSGEDPQASYRYNPSNTASIGLAANLFNVGFEILVGTRQSAESKAMYGETKSFDMQSVVLGRRWLHDIYYQRYKSFYVTFPGQELTGGAPFPQRPDILSRNLGYTATYFINPRFSLRAAWSATERQLHSQGSLALSVAVSSQLTQGSESIIPDTAWFRFGVGADATEIQFSSLGFAPGYTYSLVYRNWFVNALAMYGPAHFWTNYVTEAGIEHYDISVNSGYYLRAGLGYNGDRFFVTANYSKHGRIVRFEDIQAESASTMFRVVVGFRFVEKGFLKKNAWDYAPVPRIN
jgi:hypothetical protein